MGYFDGAANVGRFGVGMVILVDSLSDFTWMQVLAQIPDLNYWPSGGFSILHYINFQTLHVRGDSKVVIEWAKGNYDIHSVELEHWLRKMKDLIRQFSTLSFQHIFREYNTLADGLSKRAIGIGFNVIYW